MQLNGMTKLIYSSSFDSSVDVRMAIVEDPKLLTKSAGTVFDCDYDELIPDDKHVGIHLVALGDFERYGSNRNGDSFPKKACIGYHSTFVKNANLFRHHRNKDPEKRLGTVVKSAYNEPMGRVELFIHAHKEDAHDELERLEKDGEICFSMACKVAFDRCNVCNTLRRTSKDPNQCDHVRFNLGKMAEDGKIICTHNDEPNFFDISFVGRPADRIAWNLKVAAGEVVDSIKLAEAEGVWVPDHIIITSQTALEKLALLKKLAEFEAKYIKLAEFSPQTSTDRYFWELRKAAVDRLSDEQIEQIRTKEPKDVFYTLSKLGVVMDSDSFFKYAFGLDYGEIKQYMPGVRKAVRTVFNDMLKRGECQRACNDSAYDVVDTDQDLSATPVFVKIGYDLSITNERVDERVIEHTAIRHTNVKISVDKNEKIASNSSSNDELFAVLAEKYAAYKLSALSAIHKIQCKVDTNTLFAVATAQNLI